MWEYRRKICDILLPIQKAVIYPYSQYPKATTGSYFPEAYFLDSYDELQYFETIEEAAERVTEIVGCTVEATVNAIQEALEKYVEQKESEVEEVFYSFREFQVIDD